MLDVFKGDAFSMVSLTTSINKLPYQPGRLGAMGLFDKKGMKDTIAVIEERQGRLSLIQSAARGTMPRVNRTPDQKVRSFPVPHLPLNDAVMADEVQSVRKFGSENEVEGVTSVVNDKMEALRRDHEVTHEYHRCGAIQGLVKDGDGSSTLYNLFTEFGVTEQNTNVDFSLASFDGKMLALDLIRLMEDSLGADKYTSLHAICGDDFFDAFISHDSVKGAYEKWQVGTNSRPFSIEDPNVQREGFVFAGIEWSNYRGSVGDARFIPTDVARVVAKGVKDLFIERWAPANFVETVNTIGKPVYAKQRVMDFDVGIELHTQSNPFIICTRPRTLLKVTQTG